MIKFTKKYIVSLAASLMLTTMFALPALTAAQVNFNEDPLDNNYGLDDIQDVRIGQSTNLKDIIANVINIVLGFLGIIAVIIIIYAGFKWMTAGGNEETVTEARRMILQAVVGLVIIFMAWIISSFVINQLKEVTNVSS